MTCPRRLMGLLKFLFHSYKSINKNDSLKVIITFRVKALLSCALVY